MFFPTGWVVCARVPVLGVYFLAMVLIFGCAAGLAGEGCFIWVFVWYDMVWYSMVWYDMARQSNM
jgi:hypothetical protein